MGNKFGDIFYKWLDEKGYNVFKDPHQLNYVQHLRSTPTETNLVSVNAEAGTGKTSLAVLCGVYGVENEEYDRIIYIRNTVATRDVGFLPGGLDEKLAPLFAPFIEALDGVQPGLFEAWTMEDPKKASTTSTSYLRGLTFDRAYVVIDEAQNMTTHEIRTILERCKDTCKVVIIGSSTQVDDRKIERIAGLLPFVVFQYHYQGEKAVVCELVINYRGRLSAHASNISKTISHLLTKGVPTHDNSIS
mgnify:CR=1 FL=1